jgi:hypothetical protein
MARLLLTTEGQTEQIFATRVLGPHLVRFGVHLPKPRCTAIGKKHRMVHRGGVLRYKPLRDDLLAWIKQDQSPDAYFTTMIDLYGLPSDFPGFDQAQGTTDPYARVAILEQAFAADIGSQRVIPYIQLHEFEALLLTDYTKLCDYYGQERRVHLMPLDEAIAVEANPERIDDGENSAPSKRISACIPEYGRAKPTVGPIVAESIGLNAIRKACRHFNEWVEALECLGGGTQ